MTSPFKTSVDPWHSLHTLLEKHSPAVIATAIEQHGVWVHDRFNRVVKASAESNNEYSQGKALNLVADWQSELNDPGPTYSWNTEMYECQPQPGQLFGWPLSLLPNFDGTPASTSSTSIARFSAKDKWIAVAQKEAERILAVERENGIEPKQDHLAREVALALASSGIKTIRGAITAENVKREALAGKFWQSTRPRPSFS